MEIEAAMVYPLVIILAAGYITASVKLSGKVEEYAGSMSENLAGMYQSEVFCDEYYLRLRGKVK